MADLPTGTVTFLFTDLEGSTRLLEAHPDAYRETVARHHALLRGAVEAHGGRCSRRWGTRWTRRSPAPPAPSRRPRSAR
jgi:class 3 adenylate cyclase